MLARPPARRLVRRLWRANGEFVVLAIAVIALSQVVGPLVGWQGVRAWGAAYAGLGILLPGILVAVALPLVLFYHRQEAERSAGHALRPAAAWREGWRRARARELAPERVGGAVVVLALLPAVAVTFSAWKGSIPDLHPFWFDRALAAIDAALHGGRLPQDWLAPLLEQAWLVRGMDLVYGPGWLVVVSLAPFLAAYAAPSPERTRFLLAYVLTWVLLGIGLAGLGSSAGPCYFAWATGAESDPYASTMAALYIVHDRAPLLAVAMQERLVMWREMGDGSLGRGISAFPSLHVATATLVALASPRRFRVPAIVFALLILLGSVVLGWHYAVDGYAGAAGAWAIWWGVGRWQQRRGRLR